MQIGDKVWFLGLCYKITRIADGMATIKPLRVPARNSRARKSVATLPIAQLEPWN